MHKRKETVMGFNDTPKAERLHISIFGKRNSGKSSLINALTGQDIALVSKMPGTTTDPVFKAMEMKPVGPVVFVDTAGFDDEGELGLLRVERTEDVVDITDIGIMVIGYETFVCEDMHVAVRQEREWAEKLRKLDIPLLICINKIEEVEKHMERDEIERRKGYIAKELSAKETQITETDAVNGRGIENLRRAISDSVPEDFMRRSILGGLVSAGSLVMLVMPQDIQAPKGRLILPQVQTMRELLDKKCTIAASTADGFERSLKALDHAPDLIITDSQCFRFVFDRKPEESELTSFSVLFAAYKGDVKVFADGALALDDITENSRVLIAEACSHVPLEEDIGRVKIPALLRKKAGENIEIVNVSGNDFPDREKLKDFDLVIHCGACMFNRSHVMSRIREAREAGVPVTNYGIAIAKLSGILDDVKLPG
ncbi:MAG: [FeFe] hydrogenase H-cluster maturation GTPase HydF [Anaerovoracaceae bacterium]